MSARNVQACRAVWFLGKAPAIVVNSLSSNALDEANPDHACPPVIPWGSKRSLSSTRRAKPDADDGASLFACRRWRDESGLVLRQAWGALQIAAPSCPILIMASGFDEEVPSTIGRKLAMQFAADFVGLPESSHVGPLLGRQAAAIAARAANWLDDSMSMSNEIWPDP